MKALRLLRLLPDMATFENSSQVLVPDTQYKLGLLSDIDYNDLGNKVCLIDPNPTVRIACRDLDESLATKLGMNRLGIKFASLKIPSRDLGERPLVTIRNKLREYTERQFLPEFFANAADAKATVFGVLIDECIAPSKEILHAKMARFQTCSSLIIYNNATFTEDDFAGICDTGFGGKQGRTDSIGQFGLGALTMFHFTDVSDGLLYFTFVLHLTDSHLLLVVDDHLRQQDCFFGSIETKPPPTRTHFGVIVRFDQQVRVDTDYRPRQPHEC